MESFSDPGSPFTCWSAFNLDMMRRLTPNHAVNADARGRGFALAALAALAAVAAVAGKLVASGCIGRHSWT
jgi:hypothetical protein